MVLILLKKYITAIAFAILSVAFPAHSYADVPELSAHSAILICADTGDVLYENNADEQMLIASTTKIMTAIVALENCDLTEKVTVDTEWCCIEGSSMYLEAGKSYTVKELLTGMLVTSGNDAATAISCHVAGSESEFAKLMNEKAAELGMTNSSFENPHGLDAEKQYSTARDMATLARYCMENPVFRELVSTKSATIGELTFINHNKLLWNCDGCIGIKTGYTIAAGRTLVSCCERGGMRLICVTLNAPDDWNDHTALYDWGFSNYSLTVIDNSSFSMLIPTVSGVNDYAALTVENRLVFLNKPDNTVSVETEAPRFLFAGGLEGEKVGKIRIYVNGELAAEENLVYTVSNDIDVNHKLSLGERIFGRNSKPFYISGK